ncbi:response regulator [candidate division KSB1 bacterium]|nr:response regulator [candidate division KSB1 bacterium]
MSETGNSTILLVEDEPGHVELIKRMFLNYNQSWEVVTCGTLAEAREFIKSNSPRAILMDYKLPDGTGINFLSELQRNTILPFPILILTSHGNEDLAVQAIRLGAEDYIVKSEDGFRVILQRLEQAILHWQDKKEKLELQQQLNRSEAQLRAYLGATSDLFCHINLYGKLEFINEGGIQLLKCASDDLKDKNWLKCIKETTQKKIQDEIEKLDKGISIRNIPIEMINHSGEILFLEVSADILKVGQEIQGYIVTGRDITIRKKAEIEREHLLKELNQRVKELSCLYSLGKADVQNDNLDDFLSRILENIIQAMKFPEQSTAKIVLNGKEFRTNGKNFKKTVPYRANIEIQSSSIGFLEVQYKPNYDFSNEEKYLIQETAKRLGQIIAHRATQKELAKSERKYRSLIYHMQDGMMLLSESGKILEVNPAFLEIIGAEQANLDNIIISELFQLPQVEEMGLSVSHEEEFLKDFPVVMNTLNGKKKIVEMTSKPITDENGKILFNEIIIHDVTAKKKLETELIQSKARAEEANRLKTAFFHNISHELRTPLNSILGFSQLLAQKELHDDLREMIDYIILSSTNLKAIIDDLLDITKIESGKTTVNLAPVMTYELVKFLKNEFKKETTEKRLHFETRISPKVPKIFISDNLRLQQILTNLLSNAIKFTKQGKICFSVDLTGSKLLFAVSDTGIGIALENQQRIFDDFVQLDSSDTKEYGGIGLGLAISKRIAELLDGEIWVRSRVGTGTTFYVTIPLHGTSSNETNVDKTDPEEDSPIPVTSPKTMLLADDEPLSRKLVENAVKSWGWNIISVSNGKELLDTLFTVFVDLILIDMQMPVYDGFETARKIRNNPYHKNIPIIALTALSHESDRQLALEAGCNDYLTKPLDLKLLKSTLDKWINQSEFELAKTSK